MTRTQILAGALLATVCWSGCEPAPGPLDIGFVDNNSNFVRLGQDDSMPVVLGANGLNMIIVSLRAEAIDPGAPDPTVTVTVGDILMAADLNGQPVDMVPEGVGYVLRNLNVAFQTQLCCFNCWDGLIQARLRDRNGRMFEGQVSVLLSRNATCPDPLACCPNADSCPDPTMTQVCQ